MNEQLIGDLFAEATRRMTGSSSKEFSQKFAEQIVLDIYQYVDGLDTAQIISNGILRRYGMEE